MNGLEAEAVKWFVVVCSRRAVMCDERAYRLRLRASNGTVTSTPVVTTTTSLLTQQPKATVVSRNVGFTPPWSVTERMLPAAHA